MEYRSSSGIIASSRLVQSRYSSGKVSIPVARPYSLYARYKHVRGIPAPSGQSGVPISRLKMLNNLIEGLSKKKENLIQNSIDSKDQTRIDALVDQYAKELHQAVNSVPAFFASHSAASTGMVFNFSV